MMRIPRTDSRPSSTPASRPSPPAAPRTDPLSPRSASDLEAIQGVSSFDRTRSSTSVGTVEAIAQVEAATATLASAGARLESTTEIIANREARLSEQLTHLAPALGTGALQEYANSYRATHGADYAAANAAARALADVQRDVLPPAVAAAAAAGGTDVNLGLGRMGLQLEAREATAAMDEYIRHSPTGDAQLAATLGQANTSLADAVSLAATAGGGSVTGLEMVGAASDLSARAGAAFGIVGGVAGGYSAVDRIAQGDGRVEHYVSAGAAAGEAVVGLAVIAGVTVGAAVTVPLAVAGAAAGGVSSFRDNARHQAALEQQLSSLGYSADTVSGLVQSDPASLLALSGEGFLPADIQELAAVSPDTLRRDIGQLAGFGQALRTLDLSPARAVDLLESAGAEIDLVGAFARQADDVVTGRQQTRNEFLARLRTLDPLMGTAPAADWIEANG